MFFTLCVIKVYQLSMVSGIPLANRRTTKTEVEKLRSWEVKNRIIL